MGTEKRERQKSARRTKAHEAAADRDRRLRQRRLLRLTLAFFALVAVIIVAFIVFDGDDDNTDDGTASSDPAATGAPVANEVNPNDACPPENGVTERSLSFAQPPSMCLDPDKRYVAVFDTTAGEIRVDLDLANTPETANNFATLARWGYYDGTMLHRTDPSIDIIQGGAPKTNSASDPGPGYTIADEGSGFTYEPGQLVMARTSAPNSAGGQFFFSTGPATANLDADGSYVVFGKTDATGLAVLQDIIATHVADPSSGLGGAPQPAVTVNSVTVLES